MSFYKIFTVVHGDFLHSAPIYNRESPRILDLGCGTGIWGIDMAEWVTSRPSLGSRPSDLETPSSKYPGGMHVDLYLNYIWPELLVLLSAPTRLSY